LHLPLVDLRAQQKALSDELVRTLTTMLARTDWILGEELDAFEGEFADYCGTRYAIGTDSGMSALELALRASHVGPGDEVITAANTFIATALAISHAGARPVLVDVDPRTHTMSPSLVEAAITRRTKAIVPVHLYGHPADMAGMVQIAEDRGLLVLEDACQAHGARLEGRRVGSIGHAGAFSFYPAKNLGALGDGGALVTDDEELADAVRTLRDYGQRAKYEHVVKGFNRRLDTMQAAILRVKLRRLDEWNEQRRTRAALYSRLLSNADVAVPHTAEGVEHVWHLYVIRAAERDRLRATLADDGIQTGIHYPIPIHRQPAYRDLGYLLGSFPVTERCAEEILSLPMYPELDDVGVARVAAAVAEHSTGSLEHELTGVARRRSVRGRGRSQLSEYAEPPPLHGCQPAKK
jgi:dTDP-4-amino-4,6-dideoxygalactose transaminase